MILRRIMLLVLITLFSIQIAIAQTDKQVAAHLQAGLHALQKKDINAWLAIYPKEAIVFDILEAFGEHHSREYADPAINEIYKQTELHGMRRSFNKSFLKHFLETDDNDADRYTNWGDLRIIEFDFVKDSPKSNDSVSIIIGTILFQSKTQPKKYYLGKFDNVVYYQQRLYGLEMDAMVLAEKKDYYTYKTELKNYAKDDYEIIDDIASAVDTIPFPYADSAMGMFDREYAGTFGTDSITLHIIQNPYEILGSYFDFDTKSTVVLLDIKMLDATSYRIEDYLRAGYWLVEITDKGVNGSFLPNEGSPNKIQLISMQAVD